MYLFFFIIMWSYFRRVAAAGVQSVSGPTSNIASLCVFYNALCWWRCRGISGRSVSVAEGHTMWDIQSLCEHCAFGINGSRVTRTMEKCQKTKENGEERTEFWFRRLIMLQFLRSIVFNSCALIIFCQKLLYGRLISSNESSKMKKKDTYTWGLLWILIDKKY